MKVQSLSEKQKVKILDDVGKFLVKELDGRKDQLNKFIADYVKKNKLDVAPSDLADALAWSVKVTLKK